MSSCWARLKPSCPLFGIAGEFVQISSCTPAMRSLDGAFAETYLVDVCAMDDASVSKLAAYFARPLGVMPSTIEVELRDRGMPLRIEHVSHVMFHPPFSVSGSTPNPGPSPSRSRERGA